VFISGLTFAGASDAPQAVENDVRALAEILGLSGSAKYSRLCNLIESQVEIGAIAKQWMGGFANNAADAEGVGQFKSLTSSLLAAQFDDLLGGTKKPAYVVNKKPSNRGKNKVSVRVTWDGKNMDVLVNTASLRILDVTYSGVSLVNYLGKTFQSKLNAYWKANPKGQPVASLAKEFSGSRICR
jgi:ABC-type transporter MlaC component